ncbi:MAG: DNA polymerase I [Deltaproteobacteria bacterium]|nr:DNA polymerase I [Deltaproteobacteria bacterium]
MDRLFLIDTSAYFYRAYFALPPLSTSAGLPTNAIYGFTTMLLKLLEQHQPTHIAAVLDRPEPTFRHEAYDQYKANRAVMPDDLQVQIPHIRDVIEAFNIRAIGKPGFEADDIIGTLALKAAADGCEVVIVSGDKDLCQLIGPRITMLDTMKDKVMDPAAVREKYGLDPEHIVDMLALTGDTSDNVPGVPGIGPKTAQSLLAQFGSLDGIYQKLDEITKKNARAALEQNREQAYLSKRLVMIDTNVELDCAWRDCTLTPPDTCALQELYKKFEFTRLLKAGAAAEPRPEKNYCALIESADLEQFYETLAGLERFTLDLETTSQFPMLAGIVGISFAWRDHEAVYIPLAHQGLSHQPDRATVLSRLKPILENPAIGKVGHNIKYEYIVLKKYGIELQGIACDTMVASYVLNPSRYRHNLDDVALDRLNHKMISFKDVAGSGKKQITFDLVPLAQAAEYACEDSDITNMLSKLLLPQVSADGFDELFRDMEMPLVIVLAEIEMAGVKIDAQRLGVLSREFHARLDEIETHVHELAGVEFNVNSPKQLGEVLFEKLGLPVVKKTKTGYATDVDTLKELAHMHPMPEAVLEYRSLAKLVSTYVDSLPALINPATGRVHTSYNQTVTATGRLSSSDPNLQNIPIRTEEGIRIREAFVGEKGCKILSADYSQIELRILAHMSGDATLIDTFLNDGDVHARTAVEIWGDSGLDPQRRREAKVINFGIIYGMSGFGLSRELGIAPKKAQQYIDQYFARYSGVRTFLDSLVDEARMIGYVATLMGRKRFLPDINAANQQERKFAERTAINAPIQGTAADLIKIAMLNIHRRLQAEKLTSRMIMQVHDELVFEVPEDELERMAALVRQEMESVYAMRVPLKVDVGWGESWRDAH